MPSLDKRLETFLVNSKTITPVGRDLIEEARRRLKALRSSVEDLLPFAEDHWDMGPAEEGWQSPELEAKVNRARDALIDT